MKILFLDIDGVLNSAKFRYDRFLIHGSPKCNRKLHEQIDPDAVARLNKITEITGAKIVVSSTWRMGYTSNLVGLSEALKEVGITGEVIGMTPILPSRFRGAEISKWLIDNDPKAEYKFIILDDSDDMGNIYDRLIRTNLQDGLLDKHVTQAIDMLGVSTY